MTDEPKVALVTGGSQGIGLATVAAFAAHGIQVAAMARDAARLDAAVATLPHHDRVATFAGDVRDEVSVARTVRAVAERFGRIDILVNSAGVSASAKRKLAETTPPEWHRIIDTNLTGTYLMCREVLPWLAKSSDAYLLNVQSTGSYRANPGVSLYAASKFGVRALTEAMIAEYSGPNLRITSVSPGAVATSIWTHKLEPPSEAERSRMLRPADIADIFVWLIERPRYMHIDNITVRPQS
jgi:NADP-dependent 3-hydroxy acid dehydrogenase YdfG